MPKKNHSIHWENDVPTSFEVDGLIYEHLDQVPDEEDRSSLEAMVDGSIDSEFDKQLEDFDREFKKDSEAHKKTSASAEKIILGVFTGVAVLMLLIAFFSSASAILRMNGEESAPGRVVEIVQRREYVNEEDRVVREYYYPVVEFVARDGRRRSVQMTEGSSAPTHEVGQNVTVLYDANHPLDARIRSFGSTAFMWILPGITGILGLAFLGGVFVVRTLMSPEEGAGGAHSSSIPQS